MSSVVFVHAARPSLEPLMGYYSRRWPELQITNLLDDGIMRMFQTGRWTEARERLFDLISTGHSVYGAEAALITCSAVTRDDLGRLRSASPIPLLKIDEPMARLAVKTAPRLGLLATFPPTVSISRTLLLAAAADVRREIELIDDVAPEAIEALLAGDRARHDRLLIDAAERLAAQGIGALVLAQVSMGPLVPVLRERLGIPVYSSLETSESALREMLA